MFFRSWSSRQCVRTMLDAEPENELGRRCRLPMGIRRQASPCAANRRHEANKGATVHAVHVLRRRARHWQSPGFLSLPYGTRLSVFLYPLCSYRFPSPERSMDQTGAPLGDGTPDMFDYLEDTSIESLPSSLRALQEARHPGRLELMHEILVRVLTEPYNVTVLANELPPVLVDAWIEEETQACSQSGVDCFSVSFPTLRFVL